MDVLIGEIVSLIRAVNSDDLLSAPLLARIADAVIREMDERHAHRRRVADERRVMSGVSDTLEREA